MIFFSQTKSYTKNAISIRTGGVLPIEECRNARSPKNDPNHWLTLCIEEPFDLTNTARSVYDSDIFTKIHEVFFQSWLRLKETRSLDSLFKEPLFTQRLQQQYNQMKFLFSNGMTAPLNDFQSWGRMMIVVVLSMSVVVQKKWNQRTVDLINFRILNFKTEIRNFNCSKKKYSWSLKL